MSGSFFPYGDGLVTVVGDSIRVGSTEINELELLGIRDILAVPSVGASGAIYGLLMAFAMLFPNTEFMLLFPPIPIKAKWLALILGGIALYAGVQDKEIGGIAHFAHLGGMLFGYILLRMWQKDQHRFY